MTPKHKNHLSVALCTHLTGEVEVGNVVGAKLDGIKYPYFSTPRLVPRRQCRDFTGASFGPCLTEVTRYQDRRVKTYYLSRRDNRLFLFFPLGLSVLSFSSLSNMGQPFPLLFGGGKGEDLSVSGSLSFSGGKK